MLGFPDSLGSLAALQKLVYPPVATTGDVVLDLDS